MYKAPKTNKLYFDPQDFTIGQFGHRLKISGTSASMLVRALVGVGCCEKLDKRRCSRYKLKAQSDRAKKLVELS